MPELLQTDPNLTATADSHFDHLLTQTVEEPFYKSFIRNVRETINPPKLPPLEVTSKPIPVKDIWGLYGSKKESWVMSMAMQTIVVVLLFTVFSNKTVQQKVKE